MRVRNEKLKALQKAYELAEHDALLEKQQIEAIVEERKLLLENAEGQRGQLEDDLKRLRGESKSAVFARGDASGFASVGAHQSLLLDKIEHADQECSQLEEELGRALERLTVAEKELIAARIEKRKVERYIERGERTRMAITAAKEDLETEDITRFEKKT